MDGPEAGWIEITEVGTMALWDDQPPAATITLATTADRLEALVDEMIETLPPGAVTGASTYRGMDAEVRSLEGRIGEVTVYRMIVTPGAAPAKLHTGNGLGDWIRSTDSIRIVGFAAGG
ncbi:hypothetical protein SAMN04487846_0135 [Microbacterium sp. cf046]|uniref:hypothetical protein n=1 Tax=Microbacterium sp. cf046 TaxID=1761803 RepID=UPI0008E80746|nr:hypothetical protein [Microbacterium sp. cf046]SFR87185.1 hypothetical protein SAMN04487846_0135 [Microbacterium sp. cf046]